MISSGNSTSVSSHTHVCVQTLNTGAFWSVSLVSEVKKDVLIVSEVRYQSKDGNTMPTLSLLVQTREEAN